MKVTIRKRKLRSVTGTIAIIPHLDYTDLKFRVDTETVRTVTVTSVKVLHVGDVLIRKLREEDCRAINGGVGYE